MKKIYEFFKSNMIIVKWTIWYFFVSWLIFKFVFKFDMFSSYYWWKFFHATFHGFWGFVFCVFAYSALPLYIATTLIIYRKKEIIFKIPFVDKIFAKKEAVVEPIEIKTEPEPQPEPLPEYPDDLPHELRVPFTRAKNKLSLTGAISVYNKQPVIVDTPQQIMDEPNDIPIPTDFDIETQTYDNDIPQFKDIDFDNEPTMNEQTLENNTTKYFASKNIEFETYKQFVANEKYVIYEHNDEDFWIMDNDTWFAAGKQIDSPTNELIELAKQNNLTPIIYLHSQNIMDIENTIKQFESSGIHVIKNLDELN